ncbi:MAG: HlyD family efflux transporter periplasmic adaptor subunit [Pirellulales bacterium]|nr:HlyD family efflux transporter periplasmic adaptor subunit [Pirellulales bacterium]
MSTEQPIDERLLEETKQQIRGLVNEIAQLSRTDASPQEFYDQFLSRVVQALAAVGGAVWMVGDSGALELKFQINLRQTNLAENQEDQRRHGRMLQQVLAAGQGRLVPPYSGAEGAEDAGNPTEFLLVMGPLHSGQDVVGLVEVFQRAGGNPSAHRGYLRFLLRMCELASDFLKTRQLRHLGDRQALWSQLEAFTRAAHMTLDPSETAFTLANEGRRLIQCDRVTVALRRGRHCTIEAISGQDTFDKRSNTVTMLAKLATAVVRTGEPMWYTGDMSQLAPQVEEALDAYLDEAHSKTVAVLPLRRPLEEVAGAEKTEIPEPVGALIVEQIEDARPREGMLQRVEVVSEHAGAALANAIEHHSLFLMPLWKAIGHSRVLVKARNLPKTLAAVGGVLALIAALLLVPWDFTVKGDATLQPAERYQVFAAVTGDVDEVFVDHGDLVKEGQLLCKLHSVELNLQMNQLEEERVTTLTSIQTQERVKGNNRLPPEERRRAEVEANILNAKLAKIEEQIDIYSERLLDLEAISPHDGQVITWDLRHRIEHRPVQQGQLLMTVANPKGEWELEIRMPEDRMGFVYEAREEFGPDLPVEYILAEDPGRTLQGKIREIDYAAEVRGDEGNTVIIRVAVNKADLKDLRPGAGATAKVQCGKSSLGYFLFHDVYAWFQSKVLFPYF